MKNAHDIIKAPVLTEKAYDGIADKIYVFYVDVNAGKAEIKSAVEEIFGVQVAKVNVVNVKGKFRRQGMTAGYTSRKKKAYVILKKDSKGIEFFESMVQ
ncbi:MAG: 50S ribosomal protein L23 [Clostridia bacterium]|jgi:large subunit ribosomal protein L23|nr:50S ribosomal protein L23 [Clostridia bacterium]MBR3305325.1 50S ribosomal protein L23 [Christensenellaceae bacterium]